MSVVTPYKESKATKKEQVAEMFDNISPKYDFLNHFLSMGIDVLWRKKAIRQLKSEKPKQMLDVATGTGDLAIEALKLNPDKITGVDISEGMLEVGRKKIAKSNNQDRIELKYGDSENLPFDENTFDAVTVAFGVRNFENLEKGIAEIHRVMKPGGTFVVLEFSQPERFPVKQLYNFYFNNILPLFGRAISKDNAAYEYLPQSVNAFPYGVRFTQLLEKTGFKQTRSMPLTFGIASIYVGKK